MRYPACEKIEIIRLVEQFLTSDKLVIPSLFHGDGLAPATETLIQ